MRNPAFYQILDEIRELHDRKNSDYASDADPLSNFRRAEKFGLTPLQGVLVRLSDKWSRIEELSSGKVPKNESLRDSLVDNAVYSLIAVMLLDEAHRCAKTTRPLADSVSTGAASSAPSAGAGIQTPSHIRAQSERTITVNRSHHG